MATAKSLEDLKKHLECAVCLDHFQDPKVLPCLHTYCKKCLEKVQKQSNGRSVITCPECRNETEVSNGKLDSLPVNFFMNNIMSVMSLQKESQASSIECENCDSEDPPTTHCSVCSMFLCNFCGVAHRRAKRTKDHKLMSMEEVKTSSPVTFARLHMCEEHEEEALKLYCQTCEKAICRDCAMVKHRNHNYDFVKEAYSREKETILELLKKTKSKRDALKQAIEKVSTAIVNVQKVANGVERDINVWINQLIASLEKQRTELHNSLKEKTASKVKELQIQQNELEVAFSCIESSIDFTERAFQDGSQVEVLDMKKQISDRLSNLSTSTWKLDPCTGTSLYFIPDRSLLNQVEKVGCVMGCLAVAARSTVRLGMAEEGVMYDLVCGQTRTFYIQARNTNGECCSAAVDDISIEITEPSIRNMARRLTCFESEPKGTGSFCFSYKPKAQGTYSMSVKIQDKNISRSPFKWKVICWKLGDIEHFGRQYTVPRSLSFQFTRFTVTNASLRDGCFSWKIKGSSAFSVGIMEETSNNYAPKVMFPHSSEGKVWFWSNDKKRRRKNISDNSSYADTGDLFNIYLNLYKNRLLIEHICTSELYEVDIRGIKCPVTPLFDLNSQESSVFLVES